MDIYAFHVVRSIVAGRPVSDEYLESHRAVLEAEGMLTPEGRPTAKARAAVRKVNRPGRGCAALQRLL